MRSGIMKMETEMEIMIMVLSRIKMKMLLHRTLPRSMFQPTVCRLISPLKKVSKAWP